MSENDNSKSRVKRWIAKIVLAVLTPAAFFYLFILPMWAASYPNEFGMGGILFANFMLAQVVLLSLSYSVDAAAKFYNASIPNPMDRLFGHTEISREPRAASRARAVVSMFLGYFLIQYMYAVIYVFMSNFSDGHFNISQKMSPIDGLYFSMITASTVGYGEVHPISPISKLLVLSQVSLSLVYVVLLFSACSSFLREKKARESE